MRKHWYLGWIIYLTTIVDAPSVTTGSRLFSAFGFVVGGVIADSGRQTGAAGAAYLDSSS